MKREFISTRTFKYLYLCLKEYSIELRNWLNKFYKYKIGLPDEKYNDTNTRCIGIVLYNEIDNINNHIYRQEFLRFIKWIRQQEYYVKDYIYDISKNQYLIILKLPKIHNSTYDNFINGKYSKMYTEAQIKKYFTIPSNIVMNKKYFNDNFGEPLKVIRKDKNYLPNFVKKINELFGMDYKVEDYIDKEVIEYDFPPDVIKESV